MNVYGQLIYESGSYALPGADEYTQWGSVKAAKQALASTWDDLDVDPKNGQGVTLLLWKGKPDPDDMFPCDSSACMPDYVFELGPRFGVRKSY
jgi:hypothetical protein